MRGAEAQILAAVAVLESLAATSAANGDKLQGALRTSNAGIMNKTEAGTPRLLCFLFSCGWPWCCTPWDSR